MENNFQSATDQAAAFQKIWTESMSRMMQAAFTITPNSPPPEVLRQIRSGIFQALAQSWDEFMRSPQFLEGMREWMENAIAFRKMSNDFMAKVRNTMQAPSRDDMDTIMLSVRHLEKRLLDRMDELSAQLDAVNARANGHKPAGKNQPGGTRRNRPATKKTKVEAA